MSRNEGNEGKKAAATGEQLARAGDKGGGEWCNNSVRESLVREFISSVPTRHNAGLVRG